MTEQADRVLSFAEFRARIKGAPFVRDDARRCGHKQITIDPSDGSVDCEQCGKSLSPFTVLLNLVNAWDNIRKWKDECTAAGQQQREKLLLTWRTYRAWRPHLRAAKYIEKQWRGKMAPCCPHCGRGLLPEDFAEGTGRGTYGREYEVALRAKAKTSLNPQ